MSKRLDQWEGFSKEVGQHIENYTVPQYGDAPDDLASTFTKEQVDIQLMKYISRQRNGGGQRGISEDLRDYYKIAHYACMACAILGRGNNRAEK